MIIDHYPKQRRLNNGAKIIATKMVNMKVNKKIFKKKVLNAHEKYRSAYVEAKRLASLATEATGKQFEQRLMILKCTANKTKI